MAATLTYKELLAQRQELDGKIEIARKSEVSVAIAKVKELVQDYGLTAEECGFAAPITTSVSSSEGKTSKPVPPKYITPDGKKKWTGRGRTPKEFKVFTDAGRKIDEFLIKS